MNKFQLLIFLTIFSVTASFSQRDPFNPGNSSLQIQLKGDTESEILGSPYFEEMFSPGIINEVGGKSQNAYFRYNVKEDQVEVKVSPNQSETYILPRQQKFIYNLKDYSYILGTFNVENVGLIKGFVAKYYQSDRVTFIGKPFVTISQAQAAKTGYQKATPASLSVGINYYFGVEDNKLQEVNIKEKDFQKILPESKEMKQYFKDNKIKNIDDVIKMIEFYETLNNF